MNFSGWYLRTEKSIAKAILTSSQKNHVTVWRSMLSAVWFSAIFMSVRPQVATLHIAL